MKKKELIMSTLEKMGFSPECDEDDNIVIRYQLKHILLMAHDEEEPYVSMVLPMFNVVEEDQVALALAVCNKMTRELKMIKVYVEDDFDAVTASCEFFYANKTSLAQNLRRSLEVLGVVRTLYRKHIEEMSED